MSQTTGVNEEALLQDAKERLETFPKKRGNLIPILQMVQKKLAYLPSPALAMVAEYLGISANDVIGVATFYNQFRFKPPGRNPIKVCLGTACHVKGGDIILENFERKLEIREGDTTPDKEFSIERVACVGCCALAPVAVAGETLHGRMQPSKVEGLVLRIRMETQKKQKEADETSSSGNKSH